MLQLECRFTILSSDDIVTGRLLPGCFLRRNEPDAKFQPFLGAESRRNSWKLFSKKHKERSYFGGMFMEHCHLMSGVSHAAKSFDECCCCHAGLSRSASNIRGTRGSSEWPALGRRLLPNVPLITQDGKTVHFYDDLLKGKTVAIELIYTHARIRARWNSAAGSSPEGSGRPRG